MCFPRVLAYDRLRARYEVFANCGAVAGALVRMEQTRPWHRPEPDDELLLRPGSRPARILNEAERHRLATHGINPIQSLRAANPQPDAVADARPRCGGQCRRQPADAAAPRAADDVQSRGRDAVGDVRSRRSPRLAASRATGADVPATARGRRSCSARARPTTRSTSSATSGSTRRRTWPRAASTCWSVCRSTRAAEYQSFLITHGIEGSSLRMVRSNWLPAGTRMSVHAATPAPGVPADDDITVPRRTLTAAEALVRARRVSSRRTGAPIIPVVGPLAPQSDGADWSTARSTACRRAAAAPARSAVGRVRRTTSPIASRDRHRRRRPLAVPAAARSLDRDDIARFYRDLNGPRRVIRCGRRAARPRLRPV